MGYNILHVSAIGTFIEEALTKYVADGNNTLVTDIHFQLNPNSGIFSILNDDDVVFAESIVQEWIGDFGVYSVAECNLRETLVILRESGRLNEVNLMQPYSFVLIDKEKETIAELLMVDEQDTLFLNDGLLQGLDEELNVFLKELLEK